jgi:hypothetical protein
LAQELTLLKNWDQKIDHFFTTLPGLKDRAQYYKAVAKAILVHFKAGAGYEWNSNKRIKSHTTLLRPTSALFKAEEDYGLSEVGISLTIYCTL